MNKILQWLPTVIAGILGIVQVVIKFVKEALTLAVDILFPIIPNEKVKAVVLKIREIVNVADGWIQKIKDGILKWVGIA